MENSIESLKMELLNSRRVNEYAEVLLSNLLRLADNDTQSFNLSFDDLVVSLDLAVKILNHNTNVPVVHR